MIKKAAERQEKVKGQGSINLYNKVIMFINMFFQNTNLHQPTGMSYRNYLTTISYFNWLLARKKLETNCLNFNMCYELCSFTTNVLFKKVNHKL